MILSPNRGVLAAGLLLLACGGSGCLLRPDADNGDEPQEQQRPAPRVESVNTRNLTEFLVGDITFVHERHEFALIKTVRLPSLEPGETFQVYRSGVSVGQLSPSGEQKGNLIAADILGGDPQVGDTVVHFRRNEETIPEKKGLFSGMAERREQKKQAKELRKNIAEAAAAQQAKTAAAQRAAMFRREWKPPAWRGDQ